MRNRFKFRPMLEQLEDRRTPSVTLVYSAGNLSISGTPVHGSLNFTQAAANHTVTVKDGSSLLGNFSVNSITVKTGNAAVTVNVALNAGGFIPGNLSITTGNGADTVLINGGTIKGNLNVNTSGGNDTIDIATSAATTVNGSATINGAAGTGDTGNISTGAVATFNGNTQVLNVNNLTFGNSSNPAVVNGNTQILNSQDGNASNTASLNGTFNKFVQYVGGTGSDAVTLAGLYNAGSGSPSTSITEKGNGASSLTLATGTEVDGQLTYTGGLGNNNITLNDAITDSDNFLMGDGSNTVDLGTATINGNLFISGGNGGNNLGTFAGTVNGNVSILLGNGTNSFTLGAAGTINGSNFNYTGGTGVDTVDIEGTLTNLNVNLGGGTGGDTMTLGDSAVVSAAIIDFGSHTGTDFWNPPTSPTYPITLKNFP